MNWIQISKVHSHKMVQAAFFNPWRTLPQATFVTFWQPFKLSQTFSKTGFFFKLWRRTWKPASVIREQRAKFITISLKEIIFFMPSLIFWRLASAIWFKLAKSRVSLCKEVISLRIWLYIESPNQRCLGRMRNQGVFCLTQWDFSSEDWALRALCQ